MPRIRSYLMLIMSTNACYKTCCCFGSIVWVDGWREVMIQTPRCKITCERRHHSFVADAVEIPDSWSLSAPILPGGGCTDRSVNHEDTHRPLPSSSLPLALCIKPLLQTCMLSEILFRPVLVGKVSCHSRDRFFTQNILDSKVAPIGSSVLYQV